MYKGILWETTHEGKMNGIPSISTCCATNPFCTRRQQNKNSVCSKCYASTYMKMRKSLREHLIENANALSTRILSDDELPVVNATIYRLESFGDLHNATHFKNYVNIANKNPRTTFALWTKNTFIIEDVFEKEMVPKPANLIIIVSSPMINDELRIDKWWVDHVFTVYDKQYISDNNININCGAKSCAQCQLCYGKGGDFYVREKLK